MPKTAEEKKAYLKEYNRKNRERLRLLKKQYYEENKDRLYAISQETRAERIATLSDAEYEELKQKRREAVAKSYEKHQEKRREEARLAAAKKRAADPEAYRQYQKKYVAENREKVAATRKAYREANPEKERIHQGMRFRPGQTIASMREAQGGLCPGCIRPLPEGKLCHVDHCHKTGYVRALLCNKCNIVLGQAEDSPATLRRLADYLEHHEADIAAFIEAEEAKATSTETESSPR